jgi:hypothetical protein
LLIYAALIVSVGGLVALLDAMLSGGRQEFEREIMKARDDWPAPARFQTLDTGRRDI